MHLWRIDSRAFKYRLGFWRQRCDIGKWFDNFLSTLLITFELIFGENLTVFTQFLGFQFSNVFFTFRQNNNNSSGGKYASDHATFCRSSFSLILGAVGRGRSGVNPWVAEGRVSYRVNPRGRPHSDSIRGSKDWRSESSDFCSGKTTPASADC